MAEASRSGATWFKVGRLIPGGHYNFAGLLSRPSIRTTRENRSAPRDHSTARGIIPATVEKVVIITGRNRTETASRTAPSRSLPA
jgi:hypothetical protein